MACATVILLSTIPAVAAASLGLSPSSFEIGENQSSSWEVTVNPVGFPVGVSLTDGTVLTLRIISGPGSLLQDSVTVTNGRIIIGYIAPETIGTQTTVTVEVKYQGAMVTATGQLTITVNPRAQTSLTLSPSTFSLPPGESSTFTAILTSASAPLVGKTLAFVATTGSVDPSSATTDTQGRATFTYTAPSVATPASITVVFAGDADYRPSQATATGSVGEIPVTITQVSVQGAAFTIPETIKDDIASYILSVPSEAQSALVAKGMMIPTTGFLLANQENLLFVLAQQSDTGLATVEGWMLPSKITLGGYQLGVIVAKTVSFTKDGTPATVTGILADPQAYELQLVKVDATRRQVSVLYDPDDGSGVEFPVTAGYLVENPTEVIELIKNAVREGKELVTNLSKGLVEGILVKESSRLPVLDFETDYWIDSPAVTNGIVLPSGSHVLKLLESVSPKVGALVQLEDGLPVLYDVKTELKSEPVSTVKQIKQNPDTYRGKVVQLTVYGLQGTISIQEALRETTVHLPVPLDVRLEGVVTWNSLSIPPSRDEILIAFGASSAEQDRVFDNQLAEFRLVGKVVSTKLIDESLPEPIALVIYKEEKIRDVTIAELVKERIEENLHTLNWVLSNFTERMVPSIPSITPPVPVIVLPVQPIAVSTPQDLPELVCIGERAEFRVALVKPEVPLGIRLENSKISEAGVKLKETLNNVKVVVEKLENKPSGAPDPPGLVWAYFNLDVDVPADKIDSGWITFWVLKEWLATHGVQKENIIVLRFSGGEWKRIQPVLVTENATHVEFSAQIPGFSTFAIVAETAAPAEVTEGLPIALVAGVVVVVVLLASVVVWRKRKTGGQLNQLPDFTTPKSAQKI